MKNKKIFDTEEVLQSLGYIIGIKDLLNTLTFKLRDILYRNNRDKKYPYFNVTFHPSGDILFILNGVSDGYGRENIIIGRLRPDLNTLKYTLIIEKDAEIFNFDNLADTANKYINLIIECIVDADADSSLLNVRKIIEHAYLYILLNNLINNLLNRVYDSVIESNDTFDLFGVYIDTVFKDDKIIITVKNRRIIYSTNNICTFNVTFVCTPVLTNPIEYIVELQEEETVSSRPTMEEKARTAITIKNTLSKFVKSIEKCLNGENTTIVLIGDTIDEDDDSGINGGRF